MKIGRRSGKTWFIIKKWKSFCGVPRVSLGSPLLDAINRKNYYKIFYHKKLSDYYNNLIKFRYKTNFKYNKLRVNKKYYETISLKNNAIKKMSRQNYVYYKISNIRS